MAAAFVAEAAIFLNLSDLVHVYSSSGSWVCPSTTISLFILHIYIFGLFGSLGAVTD